MKQRIAFMITICLSCGCCCFCCTATPTKEDLQDVLKRGAANALYGSQHPTETSSSLGTIFVAQYFVVNKLIGNAKTTKLDANILKQLLIEQQRQDGSWQQVYDANSGSVGMIEGTVWAYWALKVMGEEVNSTVLFRARSWILSHGGLEKCNTMHQLFFSVTGNYPWTGYTWIPLLIFEDKPLEKWIYIKNHVSQWVYPHLTAMAWLIHFKPSNDLGELYHIDELHTTSFSRKDLIGKQEKRSTTPSETEMNLLQEIFKMQQPHGSFGAYTLSTMLSVVVLQDVLKRFPGIVYTEEIKERLVHAIDFLESLETNKGYHGDTDYGQWWDAVLLGAAMREAGMSSESLNELALTVGANQQSNGGVPFGFDFEYASDTDDTALSVLFWIKQGKKFASNVTMASNFLVKMQNDNGGFGAFSKNCEGSGLVGWLIDLMAKQFEGSAEIFDPSEVDVTSHVLEAWGSIGKTVQSDEPVKKAIQFIKTKQKSDGYFIGRWAINTIYCTGATIVGLSRVGYYMKEQWVANAINFILSKQNSDGGFGESSMSYVDSSWIGRGISTPTQTAWALVALLEAEKAGYNNTSDAIEKSASFLVNSFKKQGKFEDPSCVGTGHPKLIYMQYPSYPMSFPLIALARYYQSRFGPVPILK